MASEEVVISGIGGFFPRSRNLDEFKQLLLNNEIALDSRWDEGELGVTNKIGVIPSTSEFDTSFFGIHPEQCICMDSMQRVMMERTFEALLDAGVNPQDVRGKKIACYMATSIGENDIAFYEEVPSGFGLPGHARAMMPNRISYFLNLKGPSCSMNFNWVNGLQVLKLAHDAIKSGECDAAIVGTANLAIHPQISWNYNDIGVLSHDASTKCFDSEACGYARSDGIVSMFIQKASTAKRSYAEIVAIDTTFNGIRNGMFIKQDANSLEHFLKRFYKDNEIDPKCIDYVECYGCGVKATDEMELNTLDKILCKDRKNPLLVGSVIPNTGNSEASANLFSVCKALIAMETETIPATVQYEKPNPNIPGLVDGRIKVVTKNLNWNGDFIAVNGIGISSTFGHVILKRNKKGKKMAVDDDLPRLAVLSSRTEDGISRIIDILMKQKNYDVELLNMMQEIYSQSIIGHMYRGYGVVDKRGVVNSESQKYRGLKHPVWFVYSGMGSQWVKMGAGLMGLPIFADSIKKSHATLAAHNIDLIDIITSDDPKILDNIIHSFVGVAAIQIALTDILSAIGIVPDGVIGHSAGELGCAYADGCLTAEQTILSAYYRGKASSEAVLVKGMMAAVGLGYNQLKGQCPETIEIACHNSTKSCTISGPAEVTGAFVKRLQAEGTFARLVNVSNIAYHSRYIKPASPLLLNYLRGLIKDPKKRSKKWICTSIPEAAWNTDLAKTVSPEYLTNNLLSPVFFEEGSCFIPKEAVAIEIAPHGLLQAILKGSLKTGCINVPLAQRGHANSIQFLMSAIGKLHLAGIDVAVSKLYPAIEYPVSRGTPGTYVLADWDHSDVWTNASERNAVRVNSILHINVGKSEENHKIAGKTVVCFSSYLTALIKVASGTYAIDVTDIVFENLDFHDYVEVPTNERLEVSYKCILQKGSGNFSISSNGKMILTGNVAIPEVRKNYFCKTFDLDSSESVVIEANDIYEEFEHRGHCYKDTFRCIKEVRVCEDGSDAYFQSECNLQMCLEAMLQQILLHKGERYQSQEILKKIRRVNVCLGEIKKTAFGLKSTYDFATEVAHMNGLQIVGVTTTTLPKIEKSMSFEELHTINVDDCRCENFENVLNISISVALSNYAVVTNTVNIIDVTNIRNQSSKKHIDEIVADNQTLVANISSCHIGEINVTKEEITAPLLIVYRGEINEELQRALIQTDGFLLVKDGGKEIANKDITTALTFSTNKVIYKLLRKTTACTHKLVYANSNELSVNDLIEPREQWAKDISNHLSYSRRNEDFYLVIKCLPKEGIYTFVNTLRKQEQFERLKYLFILNDEKHKNINNAIMKRFVLTVLQNGCCYTNVSSSFEYVHNFEQQSTLFSNLLKSINRYSYISFNEKCVEYSIIKGSTNTVGLAYYNKEKNELYEDPIFQWNAPTSLYNENGCGLPEIYLKAFYLLKIKAVVKPGQAVLLDCTSFHLAITAAHLATSWSCPTFIIVKTDEEKKAMKNAVDSPLANILVTKGLKFETVLQNINGRKMDIIITDRYGSTLNTLLRLIAFAGKFIMLDPQVLGSIGSYRLLQNSSIAGVNLNNVFSCDKETKMKLHSLVKKGIDGKILSAIPVRVYNFDNFDEASKNHHVFTKSIIEVGKSANKFLSKEAKFIHTAGKSYMLVGEDWGIITRMCESLAHQGASKLIVVAQTKLQPQFSRRIKTLKTHFDVQFLHVGTVENTQVDTAIIFSNPQNTAEFLKKITESSIKIVNFDSRNFATLHSRKNGFPTSNVQCDVGILFNDIIPTIANVLKFGDKDVVIRSNDKVDETEKETRQMLVKRLDLMLPESIEKFAQEIVYAPAEPELIQLPTESGYVIRELPAIFIVGGITPCLDSIKQFAGRLTFPSFYAHLPGDYKKPEELAVVLAKQIECILPSGPYNILGISCGGILAIEISKILESKGSVRLFLIDGTPEAIQAPLRFLGPSREAEFNLLNRLLGVTESENSDDLMPQHLNWESLVNSTINEYDSEKRTTLKHALNYVKKYIENINNYNPPILSSAGVVVIKSSGSAGDSEESLKLCFESTGSIEICKKTPLIYKFYRDQKTILTNLEVIDLINTEVKSF